MSSKALSTMEEQEVCEGAGGLNGHRRAAVALTVPVLQVSFIDRPFDLPQASTLLAQPLLLAVIAMLYPDLKQESANQHLVQLFSPF